MRQIDGKYQTSGDLTKMDGTPIPEDEPLFLFRAHDKFLPAVLEHYIQLCKDAGSPAQHIEEIEARLEAIEEWQSQNLVEIPD